MKKITTEIALLLCILFFSMANSCQSCNVKNQQIQTSQSFKKSIDSLERKISLTEMNMKNHIDKSAEMVIIIENEIDGLKVKSAEIKKLIKTF